MNALYISYDGATDPLGQSQVIVYLEKLAKNGIEFNLLTFDKPLFLKNKQKIAELSKRLKLQRIQWTYLKYHKNPTVLATAYDLFKGIMVAVKIVRLNKSDIVHARGYLPALMALALKRLFKLKFIFDVRGLWADEKVDAGTWSRGGLLYKLTKYLERIFFLNADAVVVLTKKAKEIIEAMPYYKYNPVKINIIPTCVDLDRFRRSRISDKVPKFLKDKFVVVYLGSVGTWYMLEEMAAFFKTVQGSIKNAFFLILTPTDVIYAQETLKKAGLANNDFLVKSLAYEDVPYWLSIADVSVIFIKACFSKLTSCPTKLGESLACGIPVIINRGIGDTEELVKANRVGYVLDRFDETSLKSAVEQTLKLKAEGKSLASRCRRVAERYLSLEQGVDRYLEIYRGLSKKCQL